MQYRYRVVGKVVQPFILRGAYFIKGSEIDFCITESELNFVKERCELEEVKDLQKATETTNSVPKSKEAQKQGSTTQKEVAQSNTQPKAELPSKRQYTKRNSVSDKQIKE